MSSSSLQPHIEFAISSSWVLESESKNLENCVTFSTDLSNERVELEDVVQLDTCVHLMQNSEEQQKEPCTVTIKLSDTSEQQIIQVVVVSEARVVEFFGGIGEYLATDVGEYVDDFEDCAVYMGHCDIKIPSKELVIKFQKTRHADSLWVYGINLKLNSNQDKHSLPSFSSINFESVNEMLKEARIPLSENAEKCKTFLQAYGGGAYDNAQSHLKCRPTNSQMLMKILEAGYFNPLGETGKNMSKCISNLVPFLTRDGLETKVPDLCSSKTNKDEHEQSDVLALKTYIDQRFTNLENKIDRFEQKMKELETRQNEKLDCIIALLNKSIN